LTSPTDYTPPPRKGSTTATAPPAQGDVLTVDEAAAFLRVNRKTLYAAIQKGEVPGVVRIGKTIRLSRAALLDWFRVSAGSALEVAP
jgi:excisionase family DNA binding protein